GAERRSPSSPEPPPQPPGGDIVHPIKVDESGSFLSYDLSHRALHRRSAAPRSKSLAFYELRYRGEALKFNLSLNSRLLAPGFVSERRFGGIAGAKIQPRGYNSCHMVGEVRGREPSRGLAALSTCDGLKGVFQLMDEDYFIEPLPPSFREEGAAQPHRIYKRQAPELGAERSRRAPAPRETCGVHESLERSERRRERWEQKQPGKRRIKQRSVSREKWVETLVVADTKMVEYHGSESIEKYVLRVMNMVAGLFHHASIGNPINIAIVRLILLEDEEEDLKISHHADNTLKSFCKWQKGINLKGDSHPLHHDVAVLLTRKDICAAMNRPCETLGLSHVAGMCQPHRSCNINEDTGLPLAFTVAHELGHSFGIQHDGSSNDCGPVGKRPFIMSPQLLYDTSPLTWSRCSREYITRFLDRGWGLCLDDPPAREVLDYPLVPPGVLYDVAHQCRLQYGPYSTFCDDMDSVCNTLWCTVGNTCHSKLDAAVDGTACGEDKWCFNGECVPVGYRPEPIDGAWGSWSAWASCSRSCGAGVQSAERQCGSPTPKYGGRYCLGERKRFRICNVRPCPLDRPSFRQLQCSQFNPMPYKGKLYKWTPVPNNINPCELHCRPEDEYFAEKLRDAVVDGTPCYEGNSSRDMCINGICKNVGCDYEIDSNAAEDRCGVCRGDGSTCHTIQKTFEDTEGLGYVDIGIIPVGAREIRIEEVAEAGNFLALRSEDPEKYFLNGGWTIQWNGDYRVAGTTFTYKRTGNWENLTSPGPTVEPVWIQLLFQETNPGVRYQYTVQRPPDSDNAIEPAEFLWRFGSWTACTATCGTGVQRQVVHCVEKLAGIVEERHCDALTRPDDQQRTCSEDPCPARWWASEWQKCSATCGGSGLTKRTVLCIQSVGLDEQRALQQAECQHLAKPEAAAPCNREVPCPSQWAVGNWSECSRSCGNGTRQRAVYCSNSTGAACDPAQRPSAQAPCSSPRCQEDRADGASAEWSGSGSSSREVFNEIHFVPSDRGAKAKPFLPTAPEAGDANAIPEEDFSATRGNVFVDDFYYDYNFINFHEDLSYYPFETQGEGQRPELGTNDVVPAGVLHTVSPGRGASAAPGSALPAFTEEEEEEEAALVPHSEDHPPTQSTAVHTGLGLGQEPPGPGLASRAPYLAWPSPPQPGGQAGAGTATTRTQGGPGSSGGGCVGTEGPGGASLEQRCVPGSAERGRLTSPTPQGLGWERGRAAGSTHPAWSPSPVPSPYPAGADGVPTGQAWHWPELHTPTSPTSTPLVATTALPGSLLPTMPGPATQLPSSRLTQQDAPVPEVPTAPAPSPPVTLPARASPSRSPPSRWSAGVSEEPAPASPRAQQSSWGVPLRSTVPGHGSSWAPSGPPAFSDGEQEAPQPVPAPPPLGEEEETEKEEALLPPSSSVAATAAPGWEVGNWSEVGAEPQLSATSVRPRAEPGSGGPPPAQRDAPFVSQCSRSCGGGTKVRDVHCVDTRDERLLRPFHCQAVLYKPPQQLPCRSSPCLAWYTSSWRECSEACGGGEQERLVTCPEPGRCEETSRPNATRPCNTHPCTTWVVGSWGECTAPCGGGIQRRQVKCIDTKTGLAEEDSSLCDHEPWPESTQKCNLQDCESSESGFACERDRLTFAFCQTLRLLGRCHLPTVRLQCCRSCRQHGHRAAP
ncbi:ATS7 metalloproteinase, partial [Upupa epops]|nr:ATS7 metalloproteinase [Upupa epops]